MGAESSAPTVLVPFSRPDVIALYCPFRPSVCFLLHAALRRGEQQLDAVELIDLAGTGVIVHCGNVGPGVHLPQRLDNALAHHVVGQARKGLDKLIEFIRGSKRGVIKQYMSRR